MTIIRAGTVSIATMIDNVMIYGDVADAFVSAVQQFYRRCDLFVAQLNDAATLPREPEQILAAAATANKAMTFLGETFVAHAVNNSDKNVANLRCAFERMQRALVEPALGVTRRHLGRAAGRPLGRRVCASTRGRRIALVSDHVAIPQGQRRPRSGDAPRFTLTSSSAPCMPTAGTTRFSTSKGGRTQPTPHQGRRTSGTTWHERRITDSTFPSLRTFYHPFAAATNTPLPWWNV